MEWTVEHLTALDQALALGVRRVEYHDKIVEYRTLDEMFRLRRFIWNILYPDLIGGGRRTRFYASVSKGTR